MLYSMGLVCLLYYDRVGFWVGKKRGEGPFQQEYFLMGGGFNAKKSYCCCCFFMGRAYVEGVWNMLPPPPPKFFRVSFGIISLPLSGNPVTDLGLIHGGGGGGGGGHWDFPSLEKFPHP